MPSEYFWMLILVVALVFPIVGTHRDQPSDATPVLLGWRDARRQTLIHSCGPAIISKLASFKDISITELELMLVADATSTGITLLEFERLASAFDWQGTWYRGRLNDLSNSWWPSTLFMEYEAGHFVLLHYQFEGFALIEDPAKGFVIMPTQDLEENWTGYFYDHR